jgi:hypothetical protein
VKSPDFFKPRKTHTKAQNNFYLFIYLFIFVFEKSPIKTYMEGTPDIYKSPLGRNQSRSPGKKLGVQRRPQRSSFPQEKSLQHLAIDHITGVNASMGPI